MSDQDSPDEAVDEEERRKASAQQAAADLDRMGIDPRALGLDSPPPQPASRPTSHSPGPPPAAEPPVPPTAEPPAGAPPATSASVTPLRPEYASQQPPAPAYGQPPAQQYAQPAAGQYEQPPPQQYPQQQPPGMPMPPGVPAQRQPSPAPAPAPPAAPAPPRSAVEELLARTAGSLPTPSRTGGLFKQMTAGLITPDSAESAAHERELVAALRTRQTERRVISFFAGKGGVGTTTVVVGVGTAFAALRDENTVAVDVRSGTASLGQLLGAERPVTIRRFLNDGDAAQVGMSPTGLRTLDGVGWEQRLRRTDVSSTVERLGADHTFTLLDVGNDASEVGHAAVARSDQTVIVTSAGRTGLAALEVATARLAHTDPFAVERAIFVVACHHDEAYRNVHREAVRILSVDPARVVVLPPDETLVTGNGFDPGAVRASTRMAMLRIGAAIAVSGGRQ